MIKIHDAGFHLTLSNGVTVAVTMSPPGYETEKGTTEVPKGQIYPALIGNNAEVMIWDQDHTNLTTVYPTNDQHGDVLPCQTPDQILAILEWAATV